MPTGDIAPPTTSGVAAHTNRSAPPVCLRDREGPHTVAKRIFEDARAYHSKRAANSKNSTPIGNRSSFRTAHLLLRCVWAVDYEAMVGFALAAPGYTLGDVNDWFDGQGASAERLVPETSTIDARALAGDFAVPVFVFQGAEDFTTPTSLARSFVDSIRAPAKHFVPIEGGGHFAVFMKSSAFLGQLVSRVLPLAR